ncbi:hypothetical protein A3F34_02455 [Candidatus Roizmanbacteria bacterium RIFCSPHIGHO2_12_FULL_44_10]|uniref:Antitoxin n=1 Tax=Candidatus Roizmanbacteria bacterium RIFCSPHIGHO2_12_FULL_44_10 TaxID=1802054 RepID=A0A1F7I850_9BACT|nr:MAG: hypothetical protein A3F34_02455 [Candidatus Roizmanbacteria bacterium RIFCSPHIGHO2_12_FULL_44_10]
MKKTVNVSTARKNFSKLIDSVFVRDASYVIVKNSIPVARIEPVNYLEKSNSSRGKKLDHSLYGILKNDRRTTSQIVKDWKRKAWLGE